MDESRLQEIERELSIRYKTMETGGWENEVINDLISEVRRLKAENERLNQEVRHLNTELYGIDPQSQR